MTKFMVTIELEPIPVEQIQKLAGPEDAMVGEWMRSGVVESAYVLANLSGAYIVMHGDSSDSVQRKMSELPMYPHMRLKIEAVNDMVQASQQT